MMSIDRRRFLAGAGVGLGAAAMPFSAAPLFAADGEAWPAVHDLVQSYVGDLKVANMVVAIGQGEQSPLMIARGTDTLGGMRSSDLDSLYRIYSMTKPITGMAAMMLVDEGKIALDQPVAEILPKFANMQVQKEYDGAIGPENLEPAIRPITIRNLLTHTSGLGYSIIQSGPIKDAFEAAGVVPGQVTRLEVPAIFTRGKPVPSLAEFADRLADLPLVYQPGTRWSYSVGLDLMGRIIEVASGQSFDAFLQERILDPVGMASTFFQVPESQVGRLTTNYGVWQGTLLPIDPPGNSVYLDPPAFPFGGAGLVSSARDYDRFLKMLAGYGEIEGTRVMSEAAVRMGTSNLLPDTMDPADEFAAQFGFGAGGRVGRGAQEGTFGWGGAAGTVGFVDMKRSMRVNLMTQYMPSMAYPLTEELPEAVLSDLGVEQIGEGVGA